MSRNVRLLSAISVVALLLASCGGGDSSGRTKNSALCYATQEEKDAAVKTAQDAFDAAMGGGTPGDPLSDTTVPATEDSVVSDAPSDSVVTDSTSADGGGYRRPAIRVASSGDTTIPPSLDGGALTPEQQQAQMDLEAAKAQPLCDNSETSSEISCEITLILGGENTSTCPEVVIDFVNTASTSAFEWEAVVGGRVVASGTWNAEAESTKVVAFTYTPVQEENAGGSETTEVTCTGTMSGEVGNSQLSDDCPDGFVYSSLSADGQLWVLNRNGAAIGAEGAVLASGLLDTSTLSPETPVVFKITYEIAGGEGSADTTVANESDSPCTVTFTSTGLSWSCNDGSLFNAEIEDTSNQGVYPGVYCASEGSLTVAEGQRFWFNFFLVNGEGTFMDGWNEDRPQDEPIGFKVPEDTAGVCSGGGDQEPTMLNVPGMYSYTAIQGDTTDLAFWLPGECSGDNTFAINWYVLDTNSQRYEYSSTSHPATSNSDTGSVCVYQDHSVYDGDWIASIVGTSNVNSISGVELSLADPSLISDEAPELADMPHVYTFDSAAKQYDFVLTEETRVSITVNSGQACDYSQVDEEENGFVDPEIWLYAGNAPWSELNNDELAHDDNGYHTSNNCSAAYVDETLPAGSYFIWTENDDFSSGDTGTITVESSVELTEYSVDFGAITFTTKSVTVPAAVTIDVPAGGGNLVATLEAPDNSCDEYADPALALINLSNGVTEAVDDDSGEDYLGMNCFSSYINVKLKEGKYLLATSTYSITFDGYSADDPNSGAGSVFELKYGFMSSDGAQEEIVVEPSTDPIPPVEVPPTPNLPVDQLKSGSSASVGIPEGVETMVCTSACVDDLFALEGVTSDQVTISVGGESVVVKKGASKVRVPVSAGSRDLVITQKASDGSTQVVASTKVVTSMQKFGTTTASTSSSNGSSLKNIILVIAALIIVAGTGALVVRKKKSA